MPGIPNDPRDLRWGYQPLPSWVKQFRDTQIEAVQTCMEMFDSGYDVLIAEMPTGAGKSLVGEMLRRVMKQRAVYFVSTKQLQSQIEDAFSYAAVLWGRKNYPTADSPTSWPVIHAGMCDKSGDHICGRCDGPDDEKMGCSLCHPVSSCPYEVAKRHALAADLAVLNYSYGLTEMNYVGRFGEQKHKGNATGRIPLAIADEADVLEEELMGFVEVNISRRRQRQFRVEPPTRKTVETAFVEWTMHAAMRLKKALGNIPRDRAPEHLRDVEWVVRMVGKVRQLQEGLKVGAWVYDDAGNGSIIFRPVKVQHEAEQYLWRHADKWLLMSATICSPDVMAADLGLEQGTWASFSLPSSFSVSNRPIYVTPRADMRNKAGEGEWAKMAEAVADVLKMYPDERVFIPTVSYKLNQYLEQMVPKYGDGLAERLVTYANAASREKALKEYRKKEGAVLLAPAMDRGLDLSDEDARCVVIVKVPFPYLGDKQVSARLHSSGGREWYTNMAIRRLVQATGRAVRHEKDWAHSYILDRAFVDLYRQHERWFPRWWKEAIDWTVGGPNALKERPK